MVLLLLQIERNDHEELCERATIFVGARNDFAACFNAVFGHEYFVLEWYPMRLGNAIRLPDALLLQYEQIIRKSASDSFHFCVSYKLELLAG